MSNIVYEILKKHNIWNDEFEIKYEEKEHNLAKLLGKMIDQKEHYILSRKQVMKKDPEDVSFNASSEVFKAIPQNHDESLEGSPLPLEDFQAKVDFQMKNMPLHFGHSVLLPSASQTLDPLTADEARTAVSAYVREHLECDNSESIPLWVFCDCAKMKHLAWLCVYINRRNGCDNASVSLWEVTMKGPISKSNLPSMTELQNDHMFRSHGQRFTTTCFAMYEILGFSSCKLDEKPSISSTPGSFKSDAASPRLGITASIEWDSPSGLLHCPPISAHAKLDIEMLADNPQSPAHAYYLDVLILKNLALGLDDGHVCWTGGSLNIQKEVEKYIEDVMVDPASNRKENVKSSTMSNKSDDDTDNNFGLKERADLDFVENLWQILKECSSKTELVTSLELVLQALKTKKIQPMVHYWNKGDLVQKVRDSYDGKIKPINLNKDVTALEILVEMGVQKLSSDYVHLFTDKELANTTHLSNFLNESCTLVERIKYLEKLHLVLEFAVILEISLKLPHSIKCVAIREALQCASKLDGHFSLDVPVRNIIPLIEGCDPLNWQVAIKSEGINSVHLLSKKHPMPHMARNMAAGLESNDSEDSNYLTSITQCM